MSSGRGPTSDMSPRTTFHSDGSSSRLVARSSRPSRVSRSASSTSPCAGSGSRIVRNLTIVKGSPCSPGRSWRNSTGVPIDRADRRRRRRAWTGRLSTRRRQGQGQVERSLAVHGSLLCEGSAGSRWIIGVGRHVAVIAVRRRMRSRRRDRAVSSSVVVIGAGGFGREVVDVVEAINAASTAAGRAAWDLLGVVDDAPSARSTSSAWPTGRCATSARSTSSSAAATPACRTPSASARPPFGGGSPSGATRGPRGGDPRPPVGDRWAPGSRWAPAASLCAGVRDHHQHPARPPRARQPQRHHRPRHGHRGLRQPQPAGLDLGRLRAR